MKTPDNEIVNVVMAIKDAYLEILDGKIGHAERVGSELQGDYSKSHVDMFSPNSGNPFTIFTVSTLTVTTFLISRTMYSGSSARAYTESCPDPSTCSGLKTLFERESRSRSLVMPENSSLFLAKFFCKFL